MEHYFNILVRLPAPAPQSLVDDCLAVGLIVCVGDMRIVPEKAVIAVGSVAADLSLAAIRDDPLAPEFIRPFLEIEAASSPEYPLNCFRIR